MASGGDEISKDTNVEELVTRYPATARVFVRHRINCFGCDVARFETLAEVCRIYRQPLDQILIEGCQAVARHAPWRGRRESGKPGRSSSCATWMGSSSS